jgi:signal transduction histidine kinase
VSEQPAIILCGAGDCTELRTLRAALEAIAGEAYCVEAHHSGEGLVLAFDAHLAGGDLVPLVVVDGHLADGSGADALINLTDRDPNGPTRKVLALADDESGEADRAIAAGVLDGVLTRPWTHQELRMTAGRLVDEYRAEVDPEAADRALATFGGGHAISPLSAALQAAGDQTKLLSFLGDRDLSDHEVEQAMIDEMERVLDYPPSRRLPAGSLIVTEGESIDGITVVLDGEVRLFQEMEGREIVFHHLTAGRIIGLMSLTRSRPAVFSVEAETDVTVLPVTLAQLDSALRDSPSLAAHFVSVLVRSLARRNLRSIEQQLRIREFATTRIKESERLAVVGQLAAGVAHELNNPLQGIVAYSHLLLERLAADDGHRSSLEKIVGQADRCIAIVRALLDFSRPAAPRKQSSDMNSLLRECVELVEAQALFLNIEINLGLDPALPLVMVDPSQIQQVFVNLIINAAEAMDGDGHLTITTRLMNGEVEIEFSDTGPGIAAQDLELVFDPFFSTKEATHGTGLGLAISYGIVREHQGVVTVASEVGAGATFVVRLPITANRPWSDNREQE